MARKDKIVGMLERLVSQIPIVGGIPEGEWRGRTKAESGLYVPETYDPEEIFPMIPVTIDFQRLPRRPETRRFAQFYVSFETPDYSCQDELRKNKTKTHLEFLRLGFPQNPEGYSTADRSHLSLARCAAQEVFDIYNSLARIEQAEMMDMNNFIFFSDGHGSEVWVQLLSKRLTADEGVSYRFSLNTADGGFVTYYPDGTLALGGESRHLSPSVPNAGYGDEARRIEITKKAHFKNLERAKRILETYFSEEGLDRKVLLGEYAVINEQQGYTQVQKPSS